MLNRLTFELTTALLALAGLVAAGSAMFLLLRDDAPRAEADTPAGEEASPDPSDPQEEPEWGGVGQDQPPAPDVMPIPGATPDTTKSWWHIPYINEDNQAPVRDFLEIAGIGIGPAAEPSGLPCAANGADVALSAVDDSAVGIPLDALPSWAYVDSDTNPLDNGAVTCGGEGWTAVLRVRLEVDRDAGRRGGSITIHRGHPNAVEVSVSIPEYRWSEITIVGQPAALARPILSDLGLGHSALLIFADGVLTRIQADGLPLDDLIALGEELLR